MAAPAPSRPKLAALDSNILIHLAGDHAPSHNLVLRLVRLGLTPVVTQTVVQELGYTAEHGSGKNREMAITALTSLRQWGIQPVSLKPVGNGICEVAANIIASRGLLPEEERHDAYILIEASFWGVVMLLSWDQHLLQAPNSKLNEVLTSLDLNPVQIVDPAVILAKQ